MDPATSVSTHDQALDEAAVAFLSRDYQECFAEKRRYESLTWEMAKFTFGAYSSVLAASLGLYTFSVEKSINLIPAALALLSVGLVVGLFMLLLVIRTRVYFVVVTRYINEQRGFLLARKPLGFPNQTRMLVDAASPPYFSLASTQSWVALLLAVLNSVLGGSLFYVATRAQANKWYIAIGAFTALGLFQVIAAISYLRSRENRAPQEAVFGKKKSELHG